MSAHSADRNLLFGILALQMDFITRDQLIAGMQAWALSKIHPLAEHLVKAGALLEGDRQLLEPLVEAHIRRHGNDPQQSLGSVSSIGSVAEQLKVIQDDELEATLGFASSGSGSIASVDAGATTLVGVGPSSPGQRFRILRPHAKGGLGQVFVARDLELNREVALKEIQLPHADNQNSRTRFLIEAEVTGGLEHPGIVPIYGLGQYPDGRPFYAMRFIRGDSLAEAVDRFHAQKQPRGGYDSIEFRKLLGRFVDVCQAIEYAHSRGVLHRDLKPGNIMLGKYGETLVVDWGLAKVTGRDEQHQHSDEHTLLPSGSGSAETQMGSAIGTPAYMSPEQAAGRLDELGPPADVYSLGATLYYLLTGQTPFEKQNDVGAVLRKVQAGEFRPPRQIKPWTPKALEAICLRAMTLRPADRYASPQALADEVERFLADEPVEAFPEPFRFRARRWARKNPESMAALTATLVVGVAVIVIAFRIQGGSGAFMGIWLLAVAILMFWRHLFTTR